MRHCRLAIRTRHINCPFFWEEGSIAWPMDCDIAITFPALTTAGWESATSICLQLPILRGLTRSLAGPAHILGFPLPHTCLDYRGQTRDTHWWVYPSLSTATYGICSSFTLSDVKVVSSLTMPCWHMYPSSSKERRTFSTQKTIWSLLSYTKLPTLQLKNFKLCYLYLRLFTAYHRPR